MNNEIPDDLIRTASDRRALEEGCYFDQRSVDRVIGFIEKFCCHTKGRWYGRPFRLLKWQKRLIRAVYGWKRPDGTRRIRQVYVEIPKKNGKTELVSALILYHLIADREMGAEIYLCAYTRKQAALIFDDAKMMVESSPALRKILVIKDSFHEKTISFSATRSKIHVMSSDAPSADGKSSSFTVFDELHRQKKPDHWNVMEYAGAARSQPLLMAITTAGVDRLGVCYRQHEYAAKVESGIVVDIAFFGMVYGADLEKDDIGSPLVWEKVNPSWGETINPQDFAAEFARAKEDPAQFNNFLRLRLNIWTSEDSRFIDADRWSLCGQEFDPAELEGRTCYAGLDLSNVSDITAFVMIFPFEDGSYWVLPYFWLPKDYARLRQERDRIPYLDWAGRGLIKLTSGDVIDYDFVKSSILDCASRYNIKKLYCDPYNATQICLQLASEGLPVDYLRQGFLSLNAPCKELVRLVSDGKLHHGSNAVLDWMADNTRAVTDAHDNLKISKKHSKDKIDGIVSLVCALAGALIDQPPPEPTITFFDDK